MSNTEQRHQASDWGIPRPERRRIQRIRAKIDKRGPRLADFTVAFVTGYDHPVVKDRELRMLLPRDVYRRLYPALEHSDRQTIIDPENGQACVFANDFHAFCEALKQAVREQAIHSRG